MLKKILAHPRTRGIALDDPRVTILRRSILQEKRFLRQIYEEWYELIRRGLPTGEGFVLEVGSGAGFLAQRIPDLITSDILHLPFQDVRLDALHLPFRSASLRGVVLVDVLHHLPRPRRFFDEAGQCTKIGGTMVMIEPWVTSWSRVVYRYLHNEPFVPDATEWEFDQGGPLSDANEALPWILFCRDYHRFKAEFPQWRVKEIRPFMPFRYLLSGGLSLRSLAPGWLFPVVRGIERFLEPWMDQLAMFALIVLERVDAVTVENR